MKTPTCPATVRDVIAAFHETERATQLALQLRDERLDTDQIVTTLQALRLIVSVIVASPPVVTHLTRPAYGAVAGAVASFLKRSQVLLASPAEIERNEVRLVAALVL